MVLSIIDAVGKRKRNASDIAESLRSPIFAIWGLFMYSYFLLRGQLFLKIFRAWAKCNLSLTYTQRDKTLKLTIILISVIMLSSAILENAVLHMEFFVAFDHINGICQMRNFWELVRKCQYDFYAGHTIKYGEEKAKNASLLQMYYWRAHPYWNNSIGSHPILWVLAFFNHKFILYGGNYVDILVPLFSRALYFKFNALYKTAEKALIQPMQALEQYDTYIPTELGISYFIN